MSSSDIEKTSINEVEHAAAADLDTKDLAVGTVGLIVDGDVAQLPVPSEDPKGAHPFVGRVCAQVN